MKFTTATLPLVLACLTACALPRVINPIAPFDAEAAQRQLVDGPNSIKGSALLRQAGGGVVTCAGGVVYLMPVTEAAKEWARYVYGSPSGGFRYATMPTLTFKGRDNLFAATKSVTCDAQGTFRFEHVADGDFYVFTRITWLAGRVQGGSIMRPVKLSGGQTVDTVLSFGS